MPLILAIEPDLRQAAILKRIVKEKVKADLVVVDSRDAAMDAIARGVPDVLLLTALMSPRDEDELIQHLRSLDGADHLQTHTIPQLASSLEDRKASKGGGLLKAFRRKKEQDPAASGCDPDLFADEIRTFVRYAGEKKEERRALIESGRLAADAAARSAVPATAAAIASETSSSSWDDPFAWTSAPSQGAAHAAPAEPPDPWATDYRRTPLATPPDLQTAAPAEIVEDAPPVVAPPEIVAAESPAPSADFQIPSPEEIETPAAAVEEPVAAAAVHAAAIVEEPAEYAVEEPIQPAVEEMAVAAAAPQREPDAAVDALIAAAVDVAVATVAPMSPAPARVTHAAVELEPVPQAAIAEQPAVPTPDPEVTQPTAIASADHVVPRSLGPLATWVRFEVPRAKPAEKTTTDELHELMAHLSIPLHVAGVTYASGCRIRRVRVPGGRERRKGAVPGPVVLSRRQLAEQRQANS